MNAQWLGDILLGNFEALRQIQCGRYTAFNLQDPFAPTPHLVLNLLGEGLAPPCGLTAGLGSGLPLFPLPLHPFFLGTLPSFC